MAHCGARALFGFACLDRDDRLLEFARLGGGVGEGGHVFQAFDVQANGSDARVLGQRHHHAGDVHIGLIAHGEDGGQWQFALGGGEVDRDVAGLGDDCHAGFTQFDAVFIRPQGHARKAINEAIAIRPHEGHAVGGLE